MISDNNPSLEFYLNLPKAISRDGIKKIVTNRAPFEDVLGGELPNRHIFSPRRKRLLLKNIGIVASKPTTP